MNDGRGGTGRWRGELTDLILGRGTVARVGGARVSLHWTLPPFVLALILVRGGTYDHWPWAVAEIVGLYAVILLLHELGHVAAGWSLGLDVREVVLWPLGGLARFAPPPTWRAALWVIAAGPLVNVLLVPLLFGAWYELGYYHGGDVSQLLWTWAWVNVFVLSFNLLPIWPLDGGQMLHAVLWGALGKMRAWAVVGAVGLLGAAGLVWVSIRIGDPVTLVLAGLIGWANGRCLWWAWVTLRYLKRFGDVSPCPHCGRPGMHGRVTTCAVCGQRGDAFLFDGRCWSCGADAGELTCAECGRAADVRRWLAAAGASE